MGLVEEMFPIVQMQVRNSPNIPYSRRDDLIQECMIVVWNWVEKGETRKAYLKQKVRWRILQEMSTRGRAATGSAQSGHSAAEQAKGREARDKIKQYIKTYKAEHGSEPSGVKISQALEMSRSNVARHLRDLHLYDAPLQKQDVQIMSLDDNIGGGSGDSDGTEELSVVDLYAVEESHEEQSLLKASVAKAMTTLTERERGVVFDLYWLDHTFKELELSKKYGARATVRKALNSAKEKLATELDSCV